MTSPLGVTVVFVYIRRFIYKFLNVCPFGCTAVAGSGKVGPVSQVNHTSWVAVVIPTDRPMSVRNRCVIELFVALFMLSLCSFDITVDIGDFVIGLSQISFFCSYAMQMSLKLTHWTWESYRQCHTEKCSTTYPVGFSCPGIRNSPPLLQYHLMMFTNNLLFYRYIRSTWSHVLGSSTLQYVKPTRGVRPYQELTALDSRQVEKPWIKEFRTKKYYSIAMQYNAVLIRLFRIMLLYHSWLIYSHIFV